MCERWRVHQTLGSPKLRCYLTEYAVDRIKTSGPRRNVVLIKFRQDEDETDVINNKKMRVGRWESLAVHYLSNSAAPSD